MKVGRSLAHNLINLVIRLCIVIVGAMLCKATRQDDSILSSLPYILIGIGSGVFGKSLDHVIKVLINRKTDTANQILIEENDERNVMLADKAKAKAFDLMLLMYGGLMLAFGIMKEDIRLIVAMVAVYIVICGAVIAYRAYYDKRI